MVVNSRRTGEIRRGEAKAAPQEAGAGSIDRWRLEVRSLRHGSAESLAALVIGLALAAGCAPERRFVYRPAPQAESVVRVPVSVAVLVFRDGTEDFTRRGGQWNRAKTGTPRVGPIPPELWAKAFADDLAASGQFRLVRFVYSPSETTGWDVLIEGTVGKAYGGVSYEDPNEFAVTLEARLKDASGVFWRRTIERRWFTPRNIFDGCGLREQCMAERLQADIGSAMRSMFAEARADLVAALTQRSGAGTVAPAGDEGASGSVDSILQRILRGE